MKMKNSYRTLKRQDVFLLKDLFLGKKYKGTRDEFKKLLGEIKQYMTDHSPVVYKKRSNLDRYTTTLFNWEKESSANVREKINAWKKMASKYSFMVYKDSQCWSIMGLNIAGKFIQQPIHLLDDIDSGLIKALSQNLQHRNDQGKITHTDPLHLLVADYFGYYRPTIFISYSWPSPDHGETYSQDLYNKTAIHKMAKDFGYAGFRVLIDKDDLSPGLKIDRFFNLIPDEATDYICIMATPLYKKKYDTRSATLGSEDYKTTVEADSIIHHATSKSEFNDRVFTLLLDGDPEESIPTLLSDKIFSKFSTNDYFNTFLRLTIDAMYKVNSKKNKDIKRMIASFDKKIRPINPSKFIDPMKGNPAIIFTDPGVDDFAALGLALAPGALDIKAIVACAGNIELNNTSQNVLDICNLANRKEIPILRGSEKSIHGDPIKTDYEAHGDNGLNGLILKRSSRSYEEYNATDCVIEFLEHSREPITLISLAGLTDIALVLLAAKKNNLLHKIAGISMMGGVFDPRDANAPKANSQFPIKYGEFNFLCDPDATHIVFEICGSRNIPIPVILFDLTFTHQHCRFSKNETILLRKNPQNLVSNTIADALDIIPDVYKTRFPVSPPSQPVHDVFPVMALIKDDLFSGETINIRCQTSKEPFPGKVELVSDENCPQVFLITAMQPNATQAFFDYYADMLSRYASFSDQKSVLQSPIQQTMPSGQTVDSDSASHFKANSPRFFKANHHTGTNALPPTLSNTDQQKSVSYKLTQAIASIPGDIQETPLRAILDVAKDYAPPRFQTTQYQKPTDTVEQSSVVVIVRDDDKGPDGNIKNN